MATATDTATSLVQVGNNEPTEPSDNEDNDDDGKAPPEPWGSSKAKQHIIDQLKNSQTSEIYLFISTYTPNDFGNINFDKIRKKYANNNYNKSKFRLKKWFQPL